MSFSFRSLSKLLSLSFLAVLATACTGSIEDDTDAQEANVDVRSDQAERAKQAASRAANGLQPLASEVDRLSLGADNESIDVLSQTLKRTQNNVNSLRPVVEELLRIVEQDQRITDGTTLRATVDEERLRTNVIQPLRAMIAPANQGGTLFGIQRAASDLTQIVLETPEPASLRDRRDFQMKKAETVAMIQKAVVQATQAFDEINSWTFHRGQVTREHTLDDLYCIGQESAKFNDGTATDSMNARCNALATKVALFAHADEKIKVSVEPVSFGGVENVQNYSAPRREQAARRGLTRLRVEAQGRFRIETERKPAHIQASGLPNPPKTGLGVATFQDWSSKCFAEMDGAAQRFRWSVDRRRFLLAASCAQPAVKQRPQLPYQPNVPATVEGDVTYVWAVFE
jgi:hypothetical protein